MSAATRDRDEERRRRQATERGRLTMLDCPVPLGGGSTIKVIGFDPLLPLPQWLTDHIAEGDRG